MKKPPINREETMELADTSSARNRIIAGARSHFFAHGFRGVTVEDLATELGMSKKTLYAHFSSKTGILEAVQAFLNPPKMEGMGLTPKTGFLSIIKVVFEGAIAQREGQTYD